MGTLKYLICLTVLVVLVNSKSFSTTDGLSLTPLVTSYFQLLFKVESDTKGSGHVTCRAQNIKASTAQFEILEDGGNVTVTVQNLVSYTTYDCEAMLPSGVNSNEVLTKTDMFVTNIVSDDGKITVEWVPGVLGTEKVQAIIDIYDFGSPVESNENKIEITDHVIACKLHRIELTNEDKSVTFAAFIALAKSKSPEVTFELLSSDYFTSTFKVTRVDENNECTAWAYATCVSAIDEYEVQKQGFQLNKVNPNIVTVTDLLANTLYNCKTIFSSSGNESNEVSSKTTEFVTKVVADDGKITVEWVPGVVDDWVRVLIDTKDAGSPVGNQIEITNHIIPCKKHKIKLKNLLHNSATLAVIEVNAVPSKPIAPSILDRISEEKTALNFMVKLDTKKYQCTIDRVEVDCEKKTGEGFKIENSIVDVKVSGLTPNTKYICNAFAYHGDKKSLASEEATATTNNSNIFIANNFTLVTGILFIFTFIYR